MFHFFFLIHTLFYYTNIFNISGKQLIDSYYLCFPFIPLQLSWTNCQFVYIYMLSLPSTDLPLLRQCLSVWASLLFTLRLICIFLPIKTHPIQMRICHNFTLSHNLIDNGQGENFRKMHVDIKKIILKEIVSMMFHSPSYVFLNFYYSSTCLTCCTY